MEQDWNQQHQVLAQPMEGDINLWQVKVKVLQSQSRGYKFLISRLHSVASSLTAWNSFFDEAYA